MRVGFTIRLEKFRLVAVCSLLVGALIGTSVNVRAQQPVLPKPTTPSVGTTVASDYRIGPEDVLEISVWREETLQKEVLVRPDGNISFPLAGDMRAAGKTPAELQRELTQRLKPYIFEPTVTVSIAKLAGYRVYVLGKVNDPGQFIVGRYIDVLQALTLAGGLTPYADEDKIKILRRQNDREIVIPFDYSDVKKGSGLEQNIILKSGDVVVVP